MTEEEKKNLKFPPFAQAAEADRAAEAARAAQAAAQDTQTPAAAQSAQTPAAAPAVKPSGNTARAQKPEAKNGGVGWNRIQVGETRSTGSSTSGMKVNMDTTGWDKPADYAFKAPEHAPFKYNEADGIMGLFKPKEPEYDAAREERLKRIARVNAFGDFVKHLGAFAGGGYAPTEKRGENQAVLRAFNDVDRMREVYDARKQQYDDKVLGLNIQDHMDQRGRYDRKNDREDALAKEAHDRNFQLQEELRRMKADAYLKNNTTQTGTQTGSTSQYQNLDLLVADMAAKRPAGGSGKGPFMRVQFKDSDRIVTAEEWQARQSVAVLKDIYADVINRAGGPDGSGLSVAEQKIVHDISMLDAAMANGNNSSAVKDLLASYLEAHWDKLSFIYRSGSVPADNGGPTPSQGGSPASGGGVPSVPGPVQGGESGKPKLLQNL